MCKMVDELDAADGTLLFTCNNGKGRGVCYADPQKKYRVIYTSFVFSGIRGVDDKNELMKIYLDYFLPPTPVIEEYNNPNGGITISFQIKPRIQNNRIVFTLNNPTKMQIDLYSVAGRLIRNIAKSDFTKSIHCKNLDLNENGGKGMYLLRFNADGEVINRKVTFTQ